MSVRGLALVAVLLGALLAAVVYIGLQRLGHLERWERPQWVFTNHTLKVPYGTRAVIRSANPKAGRERLWFGAKITDPEIPEIPPGPRDLPALPQIRIGREIQVDDETVWGYVGVTYALFNLMGARAHGEWLEEIRPVRETDERGNQRLMLRATFGNPQGGRGVYFYDPADPAPESRGFGWTRMEIYGKESLDEVLFSFPAGRTVPEGQRKLTDGK
jgi:hypothetical protein